MKNFLFIIIVTVTTGLFSCTKECESTNPICKESPPTTEICLAVFERWFYNEETNSCEQKSYSGCSEYGFETKVECEECECN